MSIDGDLIAFIGGNCEVGGNIFDLLNLSNYTPSRLSTQGSIEIGRTLRKFSTCVAFSTIQNTESVSIQNRILVLYSID